MRNLLVWLAGLIFYAGFISMVPAAQRGPFSTPAEIKAAAGKLAPGDVVLLADGIWNDAEIYFEAKGSAAAPITLRAQTPGKVVLSGRSALHLGGQWLIVEGLKFTGGYAPGKAVVEFRTHSSRLASDCRLTQCAIIDYNPPDPKTNYNWVSVYGRRNRVDHCRFSGMNHQGVMLVVWPEPGGPRNETRIDHNYFGDRARGPDNGYETMRIGTSEVSMQESGARVEANYFTHCDGEMEVISNKTCANWYLGNTFVDNKGQLCLRHGQRCRVEGNFFLGYGVSNASGVRVIDAGHEVVNNYFGGLKGTGARGALVLANGVPNSPPHKYLQVKRALIAFNTFVDCRENIVIGEAGEKAATLAPEDCKFLYNVVAGKVGPLFKVIQPPVNMKFEGNFVFGAETGLPETPGLKVLDPKLAQGKDKLYRPGPGSPVVNVRPIPPQVDINFMIVDDMDGQERDGRQDAGADEVSDKPGKRGLLTPDDVGPEWYRSTASK